MKRCLKLGFVPLVDAAGLLVAHARGFFVHEGLEVQLSREASWATIRDKLAVGALDGAHMLAPMVLAQTLGLDGAHTAMVVPLTLAADASAVTVATRLGVGADPSGQGLATLVARRREMGASALTFSVVFPYSTHNYLLRQWLASAGVDPDRHVRLTVAPPPRMAELLAAGVIEGFCAGEPWNAIAVAAGAGVVAAQAAEIASGAPDKVLGLTEAFANANPDVVSALVRAIRRGLAWAQAPENRGSLASLLAHPGYLDLPADILQAGLRTVAFDEGRPTRDQGAWLIAQMRRWGQMSGDAVAAEAVYRPDLYDRALAEA